MKTDVASETVPICCEEERRGERLFQKRNIFFPLFFSFHKTFVSLLNLSQLMITSQKHWRHWRPEKTKETISVTVSVTQKLKDTGNMLCWRSHRSIFFLLFFPSSYPCEQRPLCWSRRVVTDASSQPGRREEKRENTLQDQEGGSSNQTFYANTAGWDGAS